MTDKPDFTPIIRVGVGSGTIQRPPAGALKAEFAIHHLLGAARLAKDAKNVETARPADAEVFWYSSATVLEAAAFLESSINEFYLAAVDHNLNVFPESDVSTVKLLAAVWDYIERAQALSKYETALSLAGKQPFDRGAKVYLDASSLFALRNALIHYKAEWTTDQDVHRGLEQRLSACFEPNPHAPKESPYIPYKCLGYGCAAWAVRTAVAFTYDFGTRMGVPNYLQRYDQDLVV